MPFHEFDGKQGELGLPNDRPGIDTFMSQVNLISFSKANLVSAFGKESQGQTFVYIDRYFDAFSMRLFFSKITKKQNLRCMGGSVSVVVFVLPSFLFPRFFSLLRPILRRTQAKFILKIFAEIFLSIETHEINNFGYAVLALDQ